MQTSRALACLLLCDLLAGGGGDSLGPRILSQRWLGARDPWVVKSPVGQIKQVVLITRANTARKQRLSLSFSLSSLSLSSLSLSNQSVLTYTQKIALLLQLHIPFPRLTSVSINCLNHLFRNIKLVSTTRKCNKWPSAAACRGVLKMSSCN